MQRKIPGPSIRIGPFHLISRWLNGGPWVRPLAVMPNLRAPAFERACPAVRTCCQKLWRLAATLTGSKPKVLFVRESAALGDRRFISVIQFERSRFLIGSSPASVTLLAQLPDASASLGETTNAIHREGC